jgi:PAS domain-containing protein
MPQKPTYKALEKRIAELEQQQQILTEIEERRRSEATLYSSEELYRAVVENTAAIILRVGPDGIIRFANRRALEFFGYPEEELIGKHAAGLLFRKWRPLGATWLPWSTKSRKIPTASTPMLEIRAFERDFGRIGAHL